MTALRITAEGFNEADRVLERLAVTVRGKASVSATRAAGRVVANAFRKKLPAPGYAGDKPDKKPLRQTVKVRVVEYEASGKVVAVVGTEYDGGQHGHLVEEGHEKWLWGQNTGAQVPGKHYLLQAVNETEQDAKRAFTSRLASELEKAAK